MQKIDNNENWKPVPGYEGLYEVSSLGNIRSLNYNHAGKTKELSPGINSSGYLRVLLCKDKKKKNFYLQRLIYSTFHGPIPDGMTVDHVNGDKMDNRLSNLQLLTRGDNARKSNKGRKLTATHRAKIGASQKGQTRSDESKANMKAAQKARYQREPLSEETKAKLSAAAKAYYERKRSGINNL